MEGKRRPVRVLPLMLFAMLALGLGIYAGVVRVGWQLPTLRPGLELNHSNLMVSGFLGTLIGLERAVGMGRRWTFAAPLFTGVGSLGVAAGAPYSLGLATVAVGGILFLAVNVVLLAQRPALYAFSMTLGAGAFAFGNLLWLLGSPPVSLVPWWAGFLVLTIAGERWELSRLMPRPLSVKAAFVLAIALLVTGMGLSSETLEVGFLVTGIGIITLAGWLMSKDIAWKSVRKSGLPRFIALGLLLGYGWLGISGLLWVLFGLGPPGGVYDALLHSLFLGFVFSMIFAHAPIIFPAVLGRQMAFSKLFYVHLALLHISLVLRVASDLVRWLPGIQWGGLLNATALVVFLGNTMRSVKKADGKPEASPH